MMDMKEQASKNAAASQQAACTPSGCKSCERTGVAIYPLRVAAVPKSLVNTGWHPAVPQQDSELTGGEFKYALRALREGYVYVLLDKKDWQGYQVTPEGFLRMFNAFEMPEGGKVASLSERCRKDNHDIRSSFINIDPKYKQAAVAFSSDPWSRTVLDEYKSGTRPATRFTQIALSGGNVTAEDSKRTLTVDPSLATLKSNVLEFATESIPNIADKDGEKDGAHGFFPRMAADKQTALGNRIAQFTQKYSAPVTALILDDQVGIIQELNHARMDCIQALALFTAKPENIHRKMISDAILQIKESTADQMAHSPNIQGVYTPGYTTSYSASRETQVAAAVHKAVHRMEEYYSETDRAEFARIYQSTVASFNRKIVATWKDLNAAYASPLWRALVKNDYSAQTNVFSWVRQLATITRCLQGSVAGYDMENTGKDNNKPEWISWLEDPQSPPYLALMRANPGVNDLPQQVFNGSMTYANLKSVLNSQGVSDLINSPVYQKMIASLVTSISGAFSKLENVLSAQAKTGMVRMLQGVAFASDGGPVVTVFSGMITVREYQEMLLSQLDAHGKPVWALSTEEDGRVIRSSQTGHWVQITDEVTLNKTIHARLAAPLKTLNSEKFKRGARAAGTSPRAISTGNPISHSGQLGGFSGLTPEAIDRSLTTGEIELGEADMRNAARTQLTMSKDLQSGFLGVILAGILLYATYSSLDDLKAAMPGDVQNEMSLASKSLILMAAAVEIVGQSAAVAGLFKNGDKLIRGAGVIGGIAAIVDGIALGMKAHDLNKAGDTIAAVLYGFAAFSTLLSGGVAVVSSLLGEFALLGPVGWCIALGVIALTLVSIGSLFIRSPLERWLSHSCFTSGDPEDNDPMWHKESLANMHDAMNALHAITGGMSAQLRGDWATDLMSNTRLLGNRMLAARVTLADCNPAGSDWLVELTATGGSGGRLLLARSAPAAKLAGLTAPEPQTFEKMPVSFGTVFTTPPSISRETSATSLTETWGVISSKTSRGLQLDGEFPLNAAYTGAELTVTYWPDKTRQDNSLKMTTRLDS